MIHRLSNNNDDFQMRKFWRAFGQLFPSPITFSNVFLPFKQKPRDWKRPENLFSYDCTNSDLRYWVMCRYLFAIMSHPGRSGNKVLFSNFSIHVGPYIHKSEGIGSYRYTLHNEFSFPTATPSSRILAPTATPKSHSQLNVPPIHNLPSYGYNNMFCSETGEDLRGRETMASILLSNTDDRIKSSDRMNLL